MADDVVALRHPLDSVLGVDEYRDPGLTAHRFHFEPEEPEGKNSVCFVVKFELLERTLDFRTVGTAREPIEFQQRGQQQVGY